MNGRLLAICLTAGMAALLGGCQSAATNNVNADSAIVNSSPPLNGNVFSVTSPGNAVSGRTIETSEPNEYSATLEHKAETVDGEQRAATPALTADAARSGQKRRVAFYLPNKEQIVYLNLGDKRYLIMPNRRQYAELDANAVGFEMPRLLMPDQIIEYLKGRTDYRCVGEEQFQGRAVVKYPTAGATQTGTSAGQVSGESFAYVDKPFDRLRPVVCLDEMLVPLLGETVEPLPMQAGKPKCCDYEYVRNGVAPVFIAFEPLTGRRIGEVKKRRTKSAYCDFIETLATAYPEAEQIVLVQDNLNTHSASSFCENRQPAVAFELMRRFEFHFTPRKGSSLNMAGLELSALSRQCLKGRRIESIERLKGELDSIVKERNEKEVKVSWQFTTENAREKLKRHYDKVKSKN